MNELIQFLTQPLAMLVEAAQSIVAIAQGEKPQRSALRHPYVKIDGEWGQIRATADGLQVADTSNQWAGLDTIGSGSKLTAVVPLSGVLSMHGGWYSTSTKAFANTLSKIDASPQIDAIVIPVDSPGGTVTGVTEAADTLRGIRDRGQTKTISIAEPQMASAATWIATAAGEVVATPSGEMGSIGVISMYQDWSQALENAGVKLDVARTPAKKARFSGMEPMTDEMRETMEARNVEAYGEFVKAMAANRGVTKSRVRSDFGQGEMMSAEEARSAKLVDRIATFEEVLAGIGKPGRAKGSRRADDEKRQVAVAAARERLPEIEAT
jgi:signal peptide peptidase SppA|tara:strand:+ start:3830 stop:4801 length:972 start_codon:yes stop_codon:yes gene_type:complete